MKLRTRGYTLPEMMLASFLFLIVLGIIAGSFWSTSRIVSTHMFDTQAKRDCLTAVDIIISDLRSCRLPVDGYGSVTFNDTSYGGGNNNAGSNRHQISGYTIGSHDGVLPPNALAGMVFHNNKEEQIEYLVESDRTLTKRIIPLRGSPVEMTVASNLTALSFEPIPSGGQSGLNTRLWRIGISSQRGKVRFPVSGQFYLDVAVRTGLMAAVTTRLNPDTTIPPDTLVPPVTTVTTTAVTNPLVVPPAFRPRVVILQQRQIDTPPPPGISVGGRGGVSLPSVADIMYSLPGSRTHSWHGGTYDCWGLSDLMFNAFTNAGYGARILTFATGYSSNHRQVQVFINGGWQDIDPRGYGYDWLFATHSAPGGARVIAQSSGADLAIVNWANALTGNFNSRLNSFYGLVNGDLMANARDSQDQFNAIRDLSNRLNAGSLGYDNAMSQLNSQVSDVNDQYAQIKAQVDAANRLLGDQAGEMAAVNAAGNSWLTAGWAGGMWNGYNQLAQEVRNLNIWFAGYRSQVGQLNRWLSNTQTTTQEMLANYGQAVQAVQDIQANINQMNSIVTSQINPAGTQIAQNNNDIQNLVGQINSGSLNRTSGLGQVGGLVTSNQTTFTQASSQAGVMGGLGDTLFNQLGVFQSLASHVINIRGWAQGVHEAADTAFSNLSSVKDWVVNTGQMIIGQQGWFDQVNQPEPSPTP